MLANKIKQKLDHWEKQDRTRSRMIVSKRDTNLITVDEIQCINFSSNDYLGLAKHPKIIASFLKAANQYGFGSGSSSLVSGYFDVQHKLEKRFAEWLQIDKAILFNSGYLANIGVISSLADRSNVILSDKICHASILDGIQLSRAKHYRYKHNCIEDLKRLSDIRRPDLIITESIFSMQGDIAPVQKLIDVGNKYNAAVIIDDAHGIGVLGHNGRGICEYADISQQQLACLIAPLGKAFSGIGAIVAGNRAVIESILQFARSYRYTTALPPAICSALLAALDIVITERWRRDSLKEIIQYFIENANKRGLKIISSAPTPIKSIIVGDNISVIKLQQKMLSNGFYVSCIRAPTVPENTARVRISLNCLHTKQQITRLLDNLNKFIQCQ